MPAGRIGFIGLGDQGGPMALRILSAGLALTVWARRPTALQPFVERGAEAAASIAELGAACDQVGICVLDDAGLLEVCEALVPSMRPGSRIAIHSTVLPQTCLEIARKCAERDIRVIDAPVSGGAAGAAAGALTVMCGGAAEVFEACRPVFETFGKVIALLGPLGAGQRAKIINNALLAANIGLAYAALGVGAAQGLARDALAEVLRASSGTSFGLEVCSRFATPEAFGRGADLLAKDLGLLMAMQPQDRDAEALRAAACDFLAAAAGKPDPYEPGQLARL
jgi:3-hydroxyisobutyrate dehydrogenase-like beta-hydroxyacid dehydrogenase